MKSVFFMTTPSAQYAACFSRAGKHPPVLKSPKRRSFGKRARSYKDVAAMASIPRAARAVGAANRDNPIVIIIPCHRVNGHDGGMTGYIGGLPAKKYLLELEKRDA